MSRAHSYRDRDIQQSSFSKLSFTSPTSQLILQPFFRFYYVIGSSLTSSCERPMEIALLILQTFLHFTYVTAHSPTLPSLYLRHSSFSKPSFASPTSQALHLRHLASRPCLMYGHLSSPQNIRTILKDNFCT